MVDQVQEKDIDTEVKDNFKEVDVEDYSLEQSMREYDQTTKDTQSFRRQVLDDMKNSMSIMRVTIEDGDKMITAKLSYLSQLRELLNDIDNAARNNTTIKLKKSAIEEQHQSNINVVEILSKISLNNQASWAAGDVNHPVYKDEQALAQALANATSNEVISDAELEMSDGMLPRPKEKDENDPFDE